MNETVGRRVFVGSLAGAGVGALGAVSVLDFPVAAQRNDAVPLTREIRRQLKQAFGKIRDGHADGASQAATVLRLYASTVNDDQVQALLRKANRQQLLLAQMNHGKLAAEARELGLDPSRLPPHAMDRVGREAAFDRLIKEGLSPSMRSAADFVDDLASKMKVLERSGRSNVLQVALRQPIPDQVQCGNCNNEKQQVEYAQHTVEVACAAALLFPPLMVACEAASATYLVIVAAAAICLVVVQLCEAYFH